MIPAKIQVTQQMVTGSNCVNHNFDSLFDDNLATGWSPLCEDAGSSSVVIFDLQNSYFVEEIRISGDFDMSCLKFGLSENKCI